MKFRFHSSLFDYTFNDEIKIESLNHLEQLIINRYSFVDGNLDHLEFLNYGFDNRNGWNTFLVVVHLKIKNELTPNSFPIGYSNCIIK